MHEVKRTDLAEMERILASSNPAYRLPMGCDQQGRYLQAMPQPAECCTDMGADEDPPREPLNPAEALFLCLMALLSALLVIGLVGYAWGTWFPAVS